MQQQVQFKLNIPTDVKSWVEEKALANLRSQGAEIVACLREKMQAADAHRPQS
ncbi:Arc domain-containing protein [Paracoccus limosus]|uniref:Arc domain-containing protein n=1 Tax=Paracoccus limosus TaxID=913252 RepID=A0A844HA16_9RHOB|nr:Arc domain-containing protein [Paracoccus limosus]